MVALIPGPASASAAREVPNGFFGVVADGPLIDGLVPAAPEFQRMQASGVETIRVVFDWASAQPGAGGPIDLSATDRFVADAAARRIRALPVVMHAPGWAVSGAPQYGSPPRDVAAYAAYCAALVRRYGPAGTFWAQHPSTPRLVIRAWQIWNEPNLPVYWTTQPFATGYVRLLKAARKAIKAVDRGSTIVTAGLTNGARYTAWEALRRIYAAGGRGAFDAVALHPYTAKVSGVLRTVRLARDVMRRNGGTVPVWLTEVAWSSSAGNTSDRFATWDTTERGQARMAATALRTLAAQRRALRIRQVDWYTWISPQASHAPWFSYAGLSRIANGRVVRKPALAAYAGVARRLEGP